MKKFVSATMALGLAALLSAAPQTAQTPTQTSQSTEKHGSVRTGKKHRRTQTGKTSTGNTKKPVAKSGN